MRSLRGPGIGRAKKEKGVADAVVSLEDKSVTVTGKNLDEAI